MGERKQQRFCFATAQLFITPRSLTESPRAAWPELASTLSSAVAGHTQVQAFQTKSPAVAKCHPWGRRQHLCCWPCTAPSVGSLDASCGASGVRASAQGTGSPAAKQEPWGTRTRSSKWDRLFNTTLAENTFHTLAAHFPACAWGRDQVGQEGRGMLIRLGDPLGHKGKATQARDASAISTQRGAF